MTQAELESLIANPESTPQIKGLASLALRGILMKPATGDDAKKVALQLITRFGLGKSAGRAFIPYKGVAAALTLAYEAGHAAPRSKQHTELPPQSDRSPLS